MKGIIILFVALVVGFAQQPATTTITDTLYNAVTGTPFDGSVIVQGPNLTAPGNQSVLGGSKTYLITNGVMSFSVVPNQTGTPATIYVLTFSNGDVKSCSVPFSATPLNLISAGCVDGTQNITPGIIALSQLAPTGATTGQALCFNGSVWAPGNCGVYIVTVDSSGSCVAGSALQYNRTNGNIWGCKNGVWTLAGGGSSSFSSLTPGTNTLGAMIIGTGSSFNFSGTGTVNANRVNGATVPVNATVLTTNAQGQLINLFPIPTLSMETGLLGNPGPYVGTTDGSALNIGSGTCAMFSAPYDSPGIAGVLITGFSSSDGDCLRWNGFNQQLNILTNQKIDSLGTGIVEANRIRAYPSSPPTCNSANLNIAYMDTSTTTSHYRICANVAGTPTLITVF